MTRASPLPSRPRRDPLVGGSLRLASAWLLSVLIAFAAAFGQAAGADTAEDHLPAPSVVIGAVAANAVAHAVPCPAAGACMLAAAPDPFATAQPLSVRTALRPDLGLAQRRFGGPSVTLRPPRPATT